MPVEPPHDRHAETGRLVCEARQVSASDPHAQDTPGWYYSEPDSFACPMGAVRFTGADDDPLDLPTHAGEWVTRFECCP
jgi:hypothetical protein